MYSALRASFHTGTLFPQWQGSIFVGGLAEQRVLARLTLQVQQGRGGRNLC